MEGLFSTFLLLGAIVGGVGSCSHLHPVVDTKPKLGVPNGVSVGIGSEEVKEGDKLIVYRSTCHDGRAPARQLDGCRDREVGSAIVFKILSGNSAIVKPQSGLVMDRSMNVKKQGG